MPKYIKTNSTSKKGVNFVRSIVEAHNSIFNEIPVQNDVGVDAIIEIIKNESTTGKMLAVQIKTGSSYFDEKKGICKIPVGSHFEYWNKYPLPVIGIVFVPEHAKGYWIDIKEYFENSDKNSVIEYRINKINEFSAEDFENIFVPRLLQETPILTYERTIELCKSNIFEELELGISVAFWRYGNNNEVWRNFVRILSEKAMVEIPDSLLHYFGFVVDWADVWLGREKITDENKKYVKEQLKEVDKSVIVKLFDFINNDNPIARGSVGHFAERIISNVPKVDEILEEILNDKNIKVEIKEPALWVYGSHKGKKSLSLIKELKENKDTYFEELERVEQYLKKYKIISFYT
ncbi:MAG TPA: DUF4365 domain-containing protein [Saprospiraceae bacterium]|nr:DUF4365 domain-containing protein [Saprospiraceae bacterium]